MKAFLARLYGHYHEYHAYGPPRLKYMGYLGMVSLSLFYFIRFTRPDAQLFDDIVPRGLAVAMLALLALKDHWPEKLKRYYIGYSYLVIVYSLPCFTLLVALQRGGGMPSISNTFIVLCFLVLLTDWRNTLVMLAAGTGLATLIYVLTTPDPQVPMDVLKQLPAYALIVIGGNLFKFSTEQIDAERKLRATQALAGSIAHEMRHPLSRIKQSLQGIRQALPPDAGFVPDGIPAQSVGALNRHVAEGELAVTRGLQAIAMTLDEVSAKPMDSAAFACLSAADTVHKAVQEYGYDSDEERARIDVRVAQDFSFRGDETASLFVLFNLIKNAFYYLPRHPEMRVSLTVERHAIRVRDTGPGIPREALAHLFEPFRSAGKTGGTGLGLAYCDRVMRAFGGSIACSSVPGEYTEFTLRFPPVDEDEVRMGHAAAVEALRPAFAGKRMLLVDDDAVQRLVTRRKLAALPAAVDEAAGGQEALELAFRRRYDLVLLDLNMPPPDGCAVARKLRAGHGATPASVPIVACSAEPAHLAAGRARGAGMDGFVPKSGMPLALLQALHEAIEHPRAAGRDPALDGCAVLLVDDAAWNRKAVAGYLRQAGVAVTHAAHGDEALQKLREGGAWDAVIMDIQMPGMDGLQATRAIRRAGGPHAAVPVIGLTAHSDAVLLDEARAAGMSDFITKPVDPARLLRLLRRWTRAAQGEAAAAPPHGEAGAPALLDTERLETYHRIGLFEDLINDYLPAMARVVDQLQEAEARRDMDASLQALHTLLGMSGEAGAAALHQLVRRIYVPMLERKCWPEAADWPGQIRRLAQETEDALRAHAA